VRSNYRITEDDAIGAGGAKAKVRANLAAIETLKQIEEENRPATEDEKKILVKYVGWGAFSQPMFADYNQEYAKERARLQNLMTPDEYKSARASTINAHYTSPDVIKGMWNALEHLGFKGGRVLEPSAGIGHFIGLQPEALRETSQWTAVELDTISGRITKALYGGADVRIGGFEAQTWPDDHFDLAISNVPFAATGPNDPRYKTRFSLHDYFFVKALDKVRPGGIVAFITSSYSMDKTRDVARREMEKRGTFLGAIRLPGGNQGAFKANAGTDVTTDIIFFRKRLSGEPVDLNSEWRDLVEIKTPDKTNENPEGTTQINGYFAAHPEMMLGKMRLIGSMYSKGEPVLIGPTSDIDQRITEAAQNMPANAMLPAETSAAALSVDIDTDVGGIKEGAFYLKDGEIYRRVIGVGQPQKLNKASAERVRSFMGLRDLVDQLFAAQGGQQTTPEARNAIRAELGARYDEFVAKFGPINLTNVSERVNAKTGKTITTRRLPNFSPFEEDPSAYKVAAVELYDEKTGEARKSAIFTEDVIAPYKRPTVTGPSDALAVSLNETGRVDMKLIAETLGVSVAEAPAILGDTVYLNPKGAQWQTATQYLAGDVVQKLDDAKAAVANGDERYQKNVAALEKAQPAPLTRVEITIPMGASWVPTEVYDTFIAEVMGAPGVTVSLNEVTKKWRVQVPARNRISDAVQDQWGTDARMWSTILEATLNSTPIRIETEDAEGNKTRNIEAEEAIQAKSIAMYEAFTGQLIPGAPSAIDGWIWQDEERAQRLENLYNQSYNRIVKEQHNGSHLTFPGLAKVVSFPDGSTGTINLTPARTSAIWRIIQNGNTLIDHVVGAGKAQPLGAKVLTPSGWSRMGDIRVGDMVVSADGKPTRVVGVFPQGPKQIFRVRFTDGSVTECCDEHLWLTQTRRERSRMRDARHDGRETTAGGKSKVRTLSEIRATLDDIHYVPVCAPISHPKSTLPLDAYTLGALIGDASMRQFSVQFGTTDPEIVERLVLPAGAQIKAHFSEGRCPLCWFTFGGKRPNPLNQILRDLGLWWLDSRAKFVPEIYKFAHADDRLGILQGLMDTDGGVTGRSARFTSYSKTLAMDVAGLVRSLGGVATVANREAADGSMSKYTVGVTLPAGVVPFKLRRKVAAYNAVHANKASIREPLRAIVDVSPVGEKPAQCIAVDNPSHLYVTDDYVVTHNTWTSIMAVMEMKRLGQIRRPLFTIPNHMLHQFSHEFLQAYPSAKILVADKDSMSKDKRKEFAAKAAAEKWDGIIITHSAFTRIKMQDQAYRDYYEEAIAEMVEAKNSAEREEGKRGSTVKDIEKAITSLRAKLQKLARTENKDEGITFEELGVDHITVDEAHKFKKLWFMTRHTRVRGLPKKESQRATDLYIKIRHLEKSRPGRSTLFLTGTPLSNSMAEIYTMMRFLQHDTLKEYGIGEFDSWAQTFGRIVTKTELAPNGRDFRDATSFSSFVNIPELSTLYGRIADTQTAESLQLPRPAVKGGGPVIVTSDLSEGEEKFIQSTIEKMEKMKGKPPVKGDPNFLSMFTQGLQVGTDMRLVDPDAPFNPNGKIAKATANILKIWEAGNADPAAPNKAQLVFLDMGVPGSKGKRSVASINDVPGEGPLPADIESVRKDIVAGYDVEQETETDADEDQDSDDPNADAKPASEEDAEAKALLIGKFNLYADLKTRLVAAGIPAEQIEFIHDANTDDKKAKLFEKVRSGDVRILLGSSEKMGVGTNVQKRLVALHHIDSPWTPAEVEQRDGRILRQGNQNKEIEIYRYVTKRSFDSYRWQILETKSNFIGQFRAGARGVRIAEEIDAPLPEAAELKAAATGDPRIVEHADLTRQIRILTAQQNAHAATAVRARRSIADLKAQIGRWQAFVGPYEMDALRVTDLSGDNFKVTISGARGQKTEITKRKEAGEEIKRQILSIVKNSWYSPNGTDLDLGTISGFQMTGKVKRTSDGSVVAAQFSIRGTETYIAPEGFIVNDDTAPIGLVQRYERLVRDMPSYHQAVVRSIQNAEKDLPRLEALAKTTAFPKQGELDAANKRLNELGRALKPKAPVVEKPIDVSTLATVEDVAALLQSYGIDTDLYGKGEAKSLASFLKEIKKGESQLADRDGKLVRKVAALALDIYVERDGQRLKLYEDRQDFADGRSRRRKIEASLGEKLEPGETPQESVARALKEELGVTAFKQTSDITSSQAELTSPSYPGVFGSYTTHKVEIEIDPSEYQDEYREVQTEKTNVMGWFPVVDGETRSPNIPGSALNMARRESIARARMAEPDYVNASAMGNTDTSKVPGYGSPEWKAARRYNIPADNGGVRQIGYDEAIDYLFNKAVAKAEADGGVARDRKAYVIIGFGGAGKSTLANPLGKERQAVHASADDAKLIIPEFDGGRNSGGVHEESSDLGKAVFKRLLKGGYNIILEKLGSSNKSINGPLDEFVAIGYTPTLIYVDVPKAVAMERAIARFKAEGRAIDVGTYDLNINDVYTTLKAKEGIGHAEFRWTEPEGWDWGQVSAPELAGLVIKDRFTGREIRLPSDRPAGVGNLEGRDRDPGSDEGFQRIEGRDDGGRSSQEGVTEGPVDPALSADAALQVKRRAHAYIKAELTAGRPVRVSEDVTNAFLSAAAPHVGLLPNGTRVAALTRLKPIDEATKARAPYADILGEFRSLDGGLVSVPLALKHLPDYRAAFDRASGSVLFFGNSRADVGPRLEVEVRSRIAHEAVHAVWKSLPRQMRSRLLRHAGLLGVLDMQLGTVLRAVGEQTVGTAAETQTLRRIYSSRYANAPDIQDRLDQETVAHLRELAVASFFTPAELAAVAKDMAVFDTVQEVTADERAVPAFVQAAMQASDERRTLADHFGATRIEDIGPNDPHPGRVLAFHGTRADYDVMDATEGRDVGLHFGPSDLSSAFASSRDAGDVRSRVYPVVLDLERVGTISSAAMPSRTFTGADLLHAVRNGYISGVEITEEQIADLARRLPDATDSRSNDAARAWLSEIGLDGLRYQNVSLDGSGWSYVIWDKGHVISATSGDVLFAIGGYKTQPRKGDRAAHVVMRRLTDKAGNPFLARVVENGDDITVEMYDDRTNGVPEPEISKGVSRHGEKIGQVDLNFMASATSRRTDTAARSMRSGWSRWTLTSACAGSPKRPIP
jgi:N12 class adenine-specific DNA methylase